MEYLQTLELQTSSGFFYHIVYPFHLKDFREKRSDERDGGSTRKENNASLTQNKIVFTSVNPKLSVVNE